MDFLVILATFAVIFPAELPDKSMFASVIMGTRFNPIAVWLGLAAAFFVHVVIAVTAGQLITYFPHRVVVGVVTIFFLVGGLYLLFTKEADEEEDGESEVAALKSGSFTKVVITAFGVIFLSEWGDLTQIATINLAARYDSPLSVGIGAVSALWLVAGLGVFLGNRIMKFVPMELVRKIAAFVLFALAIWSFVDFLKG